MELEDIVYELACLHESMLFCCGDRSGREDPVFAHHCMALGRIVRDLEEAEAASGPKRPAPNPVNRKRPGNELHPKTWTA